MWQATEAWDKRRASIALGDRPRCLVIGRGRCRSSRRPRPRERSRTCPGSAAHRGAGAAAKPPPARTTRPVSPSDEARDEVALGLDEGDDLRPDPERRGVERSLVLGPAIDAEQRRLGAADPDDERLPAGDHLEVVVRDPAAEQLDRLDADGPDPRGDLVDHSLTRSPAGSKSGSAATSPAIQLAEDLDLDRLARRREFGGQVGVGDRALDRVAVAAARHAADSAPSTRTGSDPSATARGSARTRQASRRSGSSPPISASRPKNVALVELHGEPEPGLERRVVGRDVRAPHAVALLEPQRVDRLVAACDEPELPAGLPDRVPEREPELGRAVELPAELADVGDAQRRGRAPPRPRALRRACRGSRAASRSAAAGSRAPSGPRGRGRRSGGDVLDGDVVAGVLADPGEVVLAEGRARDDPEALLAEPRDGEVALDPAAAVQHLRVGDRADVAGDAVRAEPFEELGGALAGDLDLGEGALVEERGASRGRRACSAPIAGDQSRPAQPRGRSLSSPRAAFGSNQFARSQPDFSPKAAPSSTRRG